LHRSPARAVEGGREVFEFGKIHHLGKVVIHVFRIGNIGTRRFGASDSETGLCPTGVADDISAL